MRRGTMCVVGLLAAVAALPQTASARPRHLPGLLGVITGPDRRDSGRCAPGPQPPSGPSLVSTHTGVASRPAPAAAHATATCRLRRWRRPPRVARTCRQAARETGTPQSRPRPASIRPAGQARSRRHGRAIRRSRGSRRRAAARHHGVGAGHTRRSPRLPAQRNAALTMPNGELRPSINEPPRAAKPPAASHLGMVGPLAWPTAYEDVIGFTLWPQQYGERLRSPRHWRRARHGIRRPGGAGREDRCKQRPGQGGEPGAAVATRACASCRTRRFRRLAAAEIERSIELTPAQQRGRSISSRPRSATQSPRSASTCRDTATRARWNGSRRCNRRSGRCMMRRFSSARRWPRSTNSLSDDQKKQFAAPTTEGVTPHDLSRGEMARMLRHAGLAGIVDAADRALLANQQGPAREPRRAEQKVVRDGAVPDGVVPQAGAGDAHRAARRRGRSPHRGDVCGLQPRLPR